VDGNPAPPVPELRRIQRERVGEMLEELALGKVLDPEGSINRRAREHDELVDSPITSRKFRPSYRVKNSQLYATDGAAHVLFKHRDGHPNLGPS